MTFWSDVRMGIDMAECLLDHVHARWATESPDHDCWCNNWIFIIWRHLTCLTPPCFCLHWCIASSQVASGYLVTIVHISPGRECSAACHVSPDSVCRWHPAVSSLQGVRTVRLSVPQISSHWLDTSLEWVTVFCNLILRWKAKVVWKTNFSWTSNASLIL